MPNFNYRGVIKKAKKCGFVFYRQADGSHELWKNFETNKTFLIAHHGNKNLATGTVLNIAKKCGFKNLKAFQNFK